MAFIKTISEDEADGKLFDVYDEIQRSRGRLSNVLRIQSLDPKALRAHLDLYMAVVFGKNKEGLARRERELVAVIVSATNGCDYCITHHGEALDKYAKDPDWVKQVATDHAAAGLEGRDAALAAYAVGLTKEPAKGRQEAVEALRAAGFTDTEILDATQVTAYFNFVNRLVHGLGVELEDDADRDYVY
ncbi:MAG: peroxidase-related enzyme [Thermoplasmatota archaeon]